MGNIIQVLKNGFYCSYSHFFPSKKSCKRLGLKFRERIRKVKFSCHNIYIFFTLHYIKKCKSIVLTKKIWIIFLKMIQIWATWVRLCLLCHSVLGHCLAEYLIFSDNTSEISRKFWFCFNRSFIRPSFLRRRG